MANIASDGNDRPGKSESGLSDSLLTYVRNWLRRRSGDPSLRESLEDIIEEHESDSLAEDLRAEERSMLLNVLNFGELRIEDVMVPRADVRAVEIDTPIGELLELFSDAAHSRLPVYRDSLDDPIGMIHIKDVIGFLAPKDGRFDSNAAVIGKLRREVLFVPPSMPVVDLFLKMQATRIHMALVIDEYGGTDGLVTIEDLVEEIVGEIEDEHDIDGAPLLQKRPDGTYVADARLRVDELERLFDVDLLPDDQDEDIDTLGGLVVALVERVPQRGELISHPSGLDFEVADADPRRIKRLRISLTDLRQEEPKPPQG